MGAHGKQDGSAAVPRRIFLLSPANLSGRRAAVLLGEAAKFDLAVRLRESGAPIGEVFSFLSGLYFRGKLAYATAFAIRGPHRPCDARREGNPSIFVITASAGLVEPHVQVNQARLLEMADVPIHSQDPRYRVPLERDLAKLAAAAETGESEIVLLGSVATTKYLEPLTAAFGSQLLIPSEFIGRGDMSRGALLLRAVRENAPLVYVPASTLAPKLSAKPKPTTVRTNKD